MTGWVMVGSWLNCGLVIVMFGQGHDYVKLGSCPQFCRILNPIGRIFDPMGRIFDPTGKKEFSIMTS